MTIPAPPGFSWDCDEFETNRQKHKGLTFDQAMFAFVDSNVLDFEIRWEDGERRHSVLGMVAVQILYVAYAEWDDGETIRIISARKAEKLEADAYFTR